MTTDDFLDDFPLEQSRADRNKTGGVPQQIPIADETPATTEPPPSDPAESAEDAYDFTNEAMPLAPTSEDTEPRAQTPAKAGAKTKKAAKKRPNPAKTTETTKTTAKTSKRQAAGTRAANSPANEPTKTPATEPKPPRTPATAAKTPPGDATALPTTAPEKPAIPLRPSSTPARDKQTLFNQPVTHQVPATAPEFGDIVPDGGEPAATQPTQPPVTVSVPVAPPKPPPLKVLPNGQKAPQAIVQRWDEMLLALSPITRNFIYEHGFQDMHTLLPTPKSDLSHPRGRFTQRALDELSAWLSRAGWRLPDSPKDRGSRGGTGGKKVKVSPGDPNAIALARQLRKEQHANRRKTR